MAEQAQSLEQSESEKSLLSSQIESLQAQKLESLADPDALQKQLLSLSYRFSLPSIDPSTEKEQLAERVKVLESQLQAQTAKSTQLQSALDASHDRASEVAQQCDAATASLAATKQELARCAAELATEKAHGEHFLQDIQAVKQQSAALRQQLDDAQERQRGLQARGDALQ